jgi:hypothetical protein
MSESPMPLMAGMFSSIGPAVDSTTQAPILRARVQAAAASFTRKAMAQTEGPCRRVKACGKPSLSALRMKFTSPWR